MFLTRYLYFQLKNNSCLILGLIFGLFLTLNFTTTEEEFLCTENSLDPYTESDINAYYLNQASTTDEYEPKINLQNKPLLPKKAVKSIQRPRYYSTELGIREKLFIGVFTSEKNINKQATALNKTLAHLANKIKFFITANVVKNNLSLSNIVGFTDMREILKPFHVLKYISDNYMEEFDYFYLISDVAFVNGRGLLEIVNGISVSEDVYMGMTAEEDSHYCSLDAGMLLSNSVVRKVKDNLEWCVRNCYSKEYFENIGRCITHSTQLKCTQTIQGRHLSSYKLPENWLLERDLKEVIDRDDTFNSAVSIYPINNYLDSYNLQMYFSRLHLQSVEQQISALRQRVSGGAGAEHWPPGAREDPTLPAPRPPDRFHQPRRTSLLQGAALMPDDWVNVAPHCAAQQQDLQHIIKAVTLKTENENPNLKYHSLVNGYRHFDPSRGMSYILDASFTDTKTLKPILKRLEVFKPLGRASVLPVPYVTENSRIVLVVPVWPYEVNAAADFLKHYEEVCMDKKKDKIYLILVLLYTADAPSKGSDDMYGELKTTSLDLSEKHKMDGLKVGWLSIRLPAGRSQSQGLLKMGAADLALRKAPLDSLVLLARPHSRIKTDFLNRVRMNTIQGYQIFSAIGFQRYHPGLSSGPVPGKAAGRFAPWDYSALSFYSRDYVTVRKSIQSDYPIVRSDKDLETLLATASQDIPSIFEMFVRFSPDLHALRATEPALVFNYDETQLCPPKGFYKNTSASFENLESERGVQFGEALLTEKCLDQLAEEDFASVTIGSRSQVAKLIFET